MTSRSNNKEIVIDLREVPDNSHNTDEHICGDFDNLGWVVLRGLRMKHPTYDAINEVSKKGKCKGKDSTWHSMDPTESHRKMKYKTSVIATSAWKQDTLLFDFFIETKRKILDKTFPGQKYIIGRYSILKNTGEIMHDQMLRRDYQPRKG